MTVLHFIFNSIQFSCKWFVAKLFLWLPAQMILFVFVLVSLSFPSVRTHSELILSLKNNNSQQLKRKGIIKNELQMNWCRCLVYIMNVQKHMIRLLLLTSCTKCFTLPFFILRCVAKLTGWALKERNSKKLEKYFTYDIQNTYRSFH